MDDSLQLKTEEIKISPDNPFENDKLNRSDCANSLTNIISNTRMPLVLSLNGGWGTGKTTFLKMWQQEIQNKGFTTLYFNAWEDDFCDNAFVALIGQLSKNLKGKCSEEIINSIKECAVPLIRNTVFNAVRTVSGGILDLKEENLKSISEKAIDEYTEAGKQLLEFKNRIADIAKEVSKDKPLVFIIDELDRCRPLFAIELMEKVKHLFEVHGIVFILGIDRKQLGYSIQSVYGQGMDVDGYLRRFIDMEFILPQIDPNTFCGHIFSQFGIDNYFNNRKKNSNGHRDDKDAFNTMFGKLCECFNLSLRDMEYTSRLLVIACRNTESNHLFFPQLLSILIILKLANTELYHRYVSADCNSDEVIEFILKQHGGKELLESSSGVIMEAYMIASSPDDWRDKVISQMNLHIKGPNLGNLFISARIKGMDAGRVKRLLDIGSKLINGFEYEMSSRTLGYLSEKIELSSLQLQHN